MKVWIQSPSRIISEGLVLLVERFGHTPSLNREPDSDLALWYLDSISKVPAPILPTLAIVSGEGKELLIHQNYYGIVDESADKTELKCALEAVARREYWVSHGDPN